MDTENLFLKHSQWVNSDGETGEKLEIEKGEMSELDITDTNLSCSVIVESYMNNSILTNNDMSDCYFLSTSFDETNLSESILSKTVFDFASLKHSILKNCIGIKASFDDANLSFADLSGSDLRRASFRRANLSHANFSNVDLTSASLDGAFLYGTSFKDAKGIDEVSAQYIFVGTEEKPIRLEGDDIHKWLIEQRRA
jgi:uncharacterized protein YjbI with pentapeptide repeats